MADKPTIAAYISSHGYGHATRCLEVLRHIPDAFDVEVVGTTPEWLVESSLQRPYGLQHLLHDAGVVQKTSLEQDIPATAERWTALLSEYPRLADAEADRLKDRDVRLTLGDISPFSRLVADRLSVPQVILANFSWDWILAPHATTVPPIREVIDAVAQIFSRCDLLLRTPLDGDLSVFPRQERVPLIARHARQDRQTTRSILGLAGERPVVLMSFGGHDQTSIPDDVWARYSDLTFLVLHDGPSPAPNVLALRPGAWHHPDLMAASDVVFGKLGYGLVGEALIYRTPLLYVERNGFPETNVMEKVLPAYLPLEKIDQERFQAGGWDQLSILLDADRDGYETMPTDGGPVAAERLV